MAEFAPINVEFSTDQERRQSQQLRQFLISENLYETAEDADKRQELLGRLDMVAKAWVRAVASALGMAETSVQEANAIICTFGSYRLGVHAPGADIDVLCVGPKYCSRETHFFGREAYCLEKILENTPGVTEVTPVRKAYVPLIKIKLCGLDLDVLYASLGRFIIPENLDLTPNSVLRGADEQSVRALNGYRVATIITRAVPNEEVFRLALKAVHLEVLRMAMSQMGEDGSRTLALMVSLLFSAAAAAVTNEVKLWAERRLIYSNVSGYLGGINMALLVAKICKWYPNKEAAVILTYVFMTFSDVWQWPAALHLVPQVNDTTTTVQSWDPNTPQAKAALMPIITPAYPAMNSSYNVTRCTLAVMKVEFKRAYELCKEILVVKGHLPTTTWAPLFAPFKFFETRTAFYVGMEVSANNDSDLEKWDGWVRSRVRLLVRQLEEHTNVRPHPDGLKPPDDASQEADAAHRPRKFYFLQLTKLTAQDISIAQARGAMNTPYALQRNAGATTAAKSGQQKINITDILKNFRTQVLEWEDYKPGMELRPSLWKQNSLPAWVFPEGHNPLLVKKEAANGPANGTASAGSKRPAEVSAAGSDEATGPASKLSNTSISNGNGQVLGKAGSGGSKAQRAVSNGSKQNSGQSNQAGVSQDGSMQVEPVSFMEEVDNSTLVGSGSAPVAGAKLRASTADAIAGAQEAQLLADGMAEVSGWLGDAGSAADKQASKQAAGIVSSSGGGSPPTLKSGTSTTGGASATGSQPPRSTSTATGSHPGATTGSRPVNKRPPAPGATSKPAQPPAKKPAGLTFKLSQPKA